MANSKYICAAYVADSAIPAVTQRDAEKLTHLNVAFGLVDGGRVGIGHLENLGFLQKIRAYNNDLKIILSVGGWGAGGFSEAAFSDYSRRLFSQSICEIMNMGIFDGVDIDWEYPCCSVAGIASSAEDKSNFTLLLKIMRHDLDELEKKEGHHYLLTIAAGADRYYIDSTEMNRVQEYLDFIQLMTYDLRGGFQVLTGHHTNLFARRGDLSTISAENSVKLFIEAGVPKSKIVIGGAFYSRLWKNVPDADNGLLQMSTGTGGYGPAYEELDENYINRNGYVRYWDDEAKAPYLFDGSTFISYDDEQSLECKCSYLKKEGLAGIMFWEYGCDKTGKLLGAAWSSLGA